MKSKLFKDVPKTTRTGAERWVRIYPDEGDGHRLFDALHEAELGRILFDADGNWIYDGEMLDVYEQEEVAGVITGHQQEMESLLNSIYNQ